MKIQSIAVYTLGAIALITGQSEARLGDGRRLGLRQAWNAGWARHYAAGGPTPGQMGQAYQYGRAITSGMGGADMTEEEAVGGIGDAWNAGWLRHYCAGGPTPGKMAEWARYCKAAAGVDQMEEEEGAFIRLSSDSPTHGARFPRRLKTVKVCKPTPCPAGVPWVPGGCVVCPTKPKGKYCIQKSDVNCQNTGVCKVKTVQICT